MYVRTPERVFFGVNNVIALMALAFEAPSLNGEITAMMMILMKDVPADEDNESSELYRGVCTLQEHHRCSVGRMMMMLRTRGSVGYRDDDDIINNNRPLTGKNEGE